MYSGSGITFDGACLWSFDNDTAINVIIFGNEIFGNFLKYGFTYYPQTKCLCRAYLKKICGPGRKQ